MWPNPRVPYEMASNRRKLEPLNGKPLMVHIAMNIEYWPFDRPMPRGIITAPHGATPAPPAEIRDMVEDIRVPGALRQA